MYMHATRECASTEACLKTVSQTPYIKTLATHIHTYTNTHTNAIGIYDRADKSRPPAKDTEIWKNARDRATQCF